MKMLSITLGLLVSIGAFGQSYQSKESARTTSSNSVSSSSSISRSSENYKFTARYSEEKDELVKELLLDRLGTRYLEVRRNTYEWIREKDGKVFFSCRLWGREVSLSLDREKASADFYELIDELGDDLKNVIQAHKPHSWSTMTPIPPQPPSNPNSTDPQLYKEQVRQAERELARAQRDLERLKKKDN